MDRRKTKDRRANDLEQDQAFACNRRIRPCRRLNNISVDEVTLETFIHQPYLWLSLRHMGYVPKKEIKK
jgi:hypothetical protein